MEGYHYLLKIIIIGDSSVGKSSIMTRFTTRQFYGNQYDPTIGVEFGSKTVLVDQLNIKLQIWDTAGQESFRSITRSYYRSSVGAIVVFDLSNQQSLDNVAKWIEETQQYGYEKMNYILVGNKSDLKKQIDQQYIQSFVQKYQFSYFETSAKTGANVDQLFYTIAKEVVDKIMSNQLDPIKEVNCGVKVGNNNGQKQSLVGVNQMLIKQQNNAIKDKKCC